MTGIEAGGGSQPHEADCGAGTGQRRGDGAGPRLRLGSLLAPRGAAEPESWSERAEGDVERLARYSSQRPPHHGD